jgi:hypothetical protein
MNLGRDLALTFLDYYTELGEQERQKQSFAHQQQQYYRQSQQQQNQHRSYHSS